MKGAVAHPYNPHRQFLTTERRNGSDSESSICYPYTHVRERTLAPMAGKGEMGNLFSALGQNLNKSGAPFRYFPYARSHIPLREIAPLIH